MRKELKDFLKEAQAHSLRVAVTQFFEKQDSEGLEEEFIQMLRYQLHKQKHNKESGLHSIAKADNIFLTSFLGKVYRDIIRSAHYQAISTGGGNTRIIIAGACNFEDHQKTGVTIRDYSYGSGEISRTMVTKIGTILKAAGFIKTTTTRNRVAQESVWMPVKSLRDLTGIQMADNFESRLIDYRIGVDNGSISVKESSKRF